MSTELKLDSDTLAAIFLGKITKWNDAKIAALNPGVTLPDKAIQAVHRSDSSGTTNIFTSYLTDVSTRTGQTRWARARKSSGRSASAARATTAWPRSSSSRPGSIGYVELSYAIESKLTMATLKNKAGNFITPSLESTSAAADGATFPDDLRFSVSNSANAEAYPIVGATWILAYDKMTDAGQGRGPQGLAHLGSRTTVPPSPRSWATLPCPSDLKDAGSRQGRPDRVPSERSHSAGTPSAGTWASARESAARPTPSSPFSPALCGVLVLLVLAYMVISTTGTALPVFRSRGHLVRHQHRLGSRATGTSGSWPSSTARSSPRSSRSSSRCR